MEKTAFRRTVITAGVAAALSAGVVALPTFAQSGGSGTTTSPSTTAPSTTPPARHWVDRQARETEYRTALAKELGVSVAKLETAEKAARQKVFLAHLDEAVTAGRISAADAKVLKDAAANGTLDQTLSAQGLKRLQARLAADVKSGELTQAQADRMLADAKQRAAKGDGFGPGFGFGPGLDGDHHGHGGRGPGGPGGPGGYPGP